MAIVNFHLSHACNISATSEKQLSTINLSQVCIYTNAAFLAAADSKRFVMFIVLLMAPFLCLCCENFGKGWFCWGDLDLGLCSSMWKTATLLGWYRSPITWRGIKVTCCYRQIEYLFSQPKVRHGIIQWNYSGHREGWERLHVWANWTWTLYLWWK